MLLGRAGEFNLLRKKGRPIYVKFCNILRTDSGQIHPNIVADILDP